MSEKMIKDFLPISGIWTIEDLASYLDMTPGVLQEQLAEWGIKVMVLSNRYKHKLFKLEDLAARIGTGKYDIKQTG